MSGKFLGLVVATLVAIGTLQIGAVSAHPLSGAIFTTLPDGSVVNENHYDAKCDVALNGGPQSQASKHLPDGTYDIAVTDPSGKTVLGVGEGRVTIANGEGTFGPTSLCVLVTPAPYDTTPNPGGVYKVWLCEEGNLFINRSCKTDNFKMKEVEKPPVEPAPTLTPEVTPKPTPLSTPVTSSMVQPPESTPTPIPQLPTQLPVSGGEPPSDGSSVIGKFLLIAGGSILSLLGGSVVWRYTRFGFF